MKNGKTNGQVIEAEIKSEEQDDILDAEIGKPKFSGLIQDFNRTRTASRAKAYKWYRSKPWDAWWDEFNSDVGKNGSSLKYKSAAHFSRVKGTTTWEKELLYEMIGPNPPSDDMRAPWLGDWEKRRSNGFWSIDTGKIKAVKAAIKQNKDALEKAQSIAPLSLPHMQRWHRLSLKIDEAFGGNPFDPNYPPTHPKNQKRVREYMILHKQTARMEMELWEMWMKIHGVNPNDAQTMLTMMSMGVKVGAAGAVAGAAIATNQLTQWDMMLAQNMREKVDTYPGLTLPDVSGEPATSKKQ